ncbi:toxin glutamine deamidase domain-containing protein [Streptomyces sp. NPDC048665]|uniref:toxin glutamine deamidase domain-containing protein n=1 Tax=Streptomyces sp. NPDC048665 TaxID=3155490 RepID=UPI0034231EB4
MLTRDAAVAAAERFLRTKAYPERPDSVVMLPDTAIAFPYGWTVRFDFREHLDTGDFASAPFSSVVVAPHDGTDAHFAPTALPTHVYLALQTSGGWPPPRGTWTPRVEPGAVHPERQAGAWLWGVYGGLVELSTPSPVYETATAWLMACRALPQPGFPDTPMLASSVVIPKDGDAPFHPAPGTPLSDLEPAHRNGDPARRLNARGCLVAVHCGINGAPSVPLPWHPSHEAPGWWSRLGHRYFPEFERVAVTDWSDVIEAIAGPGPDTRGVIWVRREIGGHEATGNLLYAHNNNGQVVFLDGLTASLARLDPPQLLRELVLLRARPGACSLR